MKAASIANREWRELNPGKVNEYQRNRYMRRIQLLNGLKNKPCMDCHDWYEPCQMDFDHRYDKKFDISSGWGLPLNILLAEIKKCDLVCANCHRIRSFVRRG